MNQIQQINQSIPGSTAPAGLPESLHTAFLFEKLWNSESMWLNRNHLGENKSWYAQIYHSKSTISIYVNLGDTVNVWDHLERYVLFNHLKDC